uniref:Putative secreted protein n=1 Tax=Xenopsylla cheopis TaxID=163159 RepID=A0A6M2DZZ0_XENCH
MAHSRWQLLSFASGPCLICIVSASIKSHINKMSSTQITSKNPKLPVYKNRYNILVTFLQWNVSDPSLLMSRLRSTGCSILW